MKRGNVYGDTKKKTGRDPLDAPRSPSLELMRPVLSPIRPRTGVGGTGVRSRRARWRSGSRRSSAGYTETGIVGKIHLDMITTLLYY